MNKDLAFVRSVILAGQPENYRPTVVLIDPNGELPDPPDGENPDLPKNNLGYFSKNWPEFCEFLYLLNPIAADETDGQFKERVDVLLKQMRSAALSGDGAKAPTLVLDFSAYWRQQQMAIKHLWLHVMPGGWWVIERMDTSTDAAYSSPPEPESRDKLWQPTANEMFPLIMRLLLGEAGLGRFAADEGHVLLGR